MRSIIPIMQEFNNILAWLEGVKEIALNREVHENKQIFESKVSIGQKLFDRACKGSGIKIKVSIENEDERFNKGRQKVTRLI